MYARPSVGRLPCPVCLLRHATIRPISQVPNFAFLGVGSVKAPGRGGDSKVGFTHIPNDRLAGPITLWDLGGLTFDKRL